MNISCSNCPAKYALPDHKVRGRRVRITCKHCGAAIIVDGQALDNATVGAPATSPAAPSPAKPAQAVESGSATEPASSAAPAQANPAQVAPPRPDQARPVQAAALKPGTPVSSSGETQRPRTAPAEFKQSVATQRKSTPKRAEPEWTVAITDDHHEEMDTPEIVALYAAGTIGAETFVWKDGMKDWLMPFEIPELARALKARGIAPPSEEPEFERAPKSFGVWREPGSWNEPPRAPGAEDDDVDFNDVTVSMAAPQAEELLRAVEQSAPGSTRYAQDDDGEATVIRPGLNDDDAEDDDATTIMASPFSAESTLLGTELPPPEEPPPEPAPRSRLPSITGDGHLTGERNESSVLFSLEAMAKSASPKPKEPAEPEDLFRAQPAPTVEETGPRAALGSLADEQLVNAFTVAAQPEEAPPPPSPPVAEPAPPSPRAEPAQPPPAARGWLWLLLIVVALAGLAAAAVILRIPRALFANASASPPQPSAPSAPAAEPAPAFVAPSAGATPSSSATASASPSSSATASASPSASAKPAAHPALLAPPQGTAPTHTTAKFFAPHATAPGALPHPAQSSHAAPPAKAAATSSSGVETPTPTPPSNP